MKTLKQKLLNKEYSQLRLALGVILHSSNALITLLAVGFIIFTTPELNNKTLIFWLALANTIFQLIVVWYLYYSKDIHSFARNAIYSCLMMANIWICLFMFSLTFNK